VGTQTREVRRVGPWPNVPATLVLPVFVLTDLFALWLGRMPRLPGTALVRPAAADGFVWLLWAAGRSTRTLLVSGVLLAGSAIAVNYLTGGVSMPLAVVLGGANLVQALTASALLRRLRPQAWRLRHRADPAVWVLACTRRLSRRHRPRTGRSGGDVPAGLLESRRGLDAAQCDEHLRLRRPRPARIAGDDVTDNLPRCPRVGLLPRVRSQGRN